ncbi:MAG TPA: hypothetical protein VN513_17085, partial [Gemmatimonadales bacterium]|nr:hypothetical protein [Gemmatimonadales bacterium]
RELAAVAALRAGRCEDAAAGLLELLDFAMDRANGPALVRDCWTGRGLTGAGSSIPGAVARPGTAAQPRR